MLTTDDKIEVRLIAREEVLAVFDESNRVVRSLEHQVRNLEGAVDAHRAATTGAIDDLNREMNGKVDGLYQLMLLIAQHLDIEVPAPEEE